MVYDLIIIGGASAALSAAIYAARKKLNTLILTGKVGGQSLLTDSIKNYPGFKEISGYDLIVKFREQAESFGAKIQEGKLVESIAKNGDNFEVKTNDGQSFEAKSIIVATGKRPRNLDVPGEKEFANKGVSYCSTCDAPLFGEKDVAVIGGGNSGLEAAMDLTKYANKIYVLEFGPKIIGDEATQEQLRETKKVEFITDAATKEIRGNKFVDSLIYEDRKSGEKKDLKIQGIFVEIGQIPSSDFTKGFLQMNPRGEIIIDLKTNQTSVEGIFAAGDVTDVLYKQCIIAAGEGAKAALSAYKYLQGK